MEYGWNDTHLLLDLWMNDPSSRFMNEWHPSPKGMYKLIKISFNNEIFH